MNTGNIVRVEARLRAAIRATYVAFISCGFAMATGSLRPLPAGTRSPTHPER